MSTNTSASPSGTFISGLYSFSAFVFGSVVPFPTLSLNVATSDPRIRYRRLAGPYPAVLRSCYTLIPYKDSHLFQRYQWNSLRCSQFAQLTKTYRPHCHICRLLVFLTIIWNRIVCEDQYQVAYVYVFAVVVVHGFRHIPIRVAFAHRQVLQREGEVVQIDYSVFV